MLKYSRKYQLYFVLEMFFVYCTYSDKITSYCYAIVRRNEKKKKTYALTFLSCDLFRVISLINTEDRDYFFKKVP